MRKACINHVYELAKRDERVVFIGSDLGPGLLDEMKAEMPDRWYMEGVSEQHCVGMAAGLALEGYIPYFNTIATFITRRCFEQVAVDLCLHDLPVRLIGNGGGVVYAPLGPTHLAIEDISIFRPLPNMTIFCAADADEMVRFMDTSLDWPHPIYIRLAKGGDPIVSSPEHGFEIGKGIVLRDEGPVLIIAMGAMVSRALDAAELLKARGIRCRVVNMHTVKPLDTGLVDELAADSDLIVTCEEHVRTGGLGSAVIEHLSDSGQTGTPVLRLALPDRFPTEYGSQDSMLETAGLQPPQLAAAIEVALSRTTATGTGKAS
ncbi:MAG: transketolase C-terminal domain-containing protein [Rhodospirillales bacterium]